MRIKMGKKERIRYYERKRLRDNICKEQPLPVSAVEDHTIRRRKRKAKAIKHLRFPANLCNDNVDGDYVLRLRECVSECVWVCSSYG